jgi:hypothetical protein
MKTIVSPPLARATPTPTRTHTHTHCVDKNTLEVGRIEISDGLDRSTTAANAIIGIARGWNGITVLLLYIFSHEVTNAIHDLM